MWPLLILGFWQNLIENLGTKDCGWSYNVKKISCQFPSGWGTVIILNEITSIYENHTGRAFKDFQGFCGFIYFARYE